MQTATGFRFNIFDMMSALVYARVVHPCSKLKTYIEVIPKLFEKYDFSLDQLYSGLGYIGSEYEKIIEIFNHQVALKYPFDTSHSYFDCTNFYFEIDREDDFRPKGPSKEKKESINYIITHLCHIFCVLPGILSSKHNAPYPTCGFGYSVNPGNGLAPLLRYAFTFSPYRYRSFPRTIPHSIISAAAPDTNGVAKDVPVNV